MKIFTILVLVICNWAIYADSLEAQKRKYDDQGRLIKEEFPNGKSIEISYDKLNRVVEISLEESGSISYEDIDTNLLHLSRISPNGKILYTHSYEYNHKGGLLCENMISNLGQISYQRKLNEELLYIESPYSQEVCKFDSEGLITSHFVNGKMFENCCDEMHELNLDNEIEKSMLVEYDLNGNLTKKISSCGRFYFEFDHYGNLVEAITSKGKVNYFYDEFGRRIAKKIQHQEREETETYLYFGNNEIAIYNENGSLKQLRIPGLSFNDNFILPVAIETEETVYATIHDCRGNLSTLIDIGNREIIAIPAIDPFGQNLKNITSLTPWIFATKHYDEETNLVYFGSRYYDPELKQWITPDPFGIHQHPNVYLYCLGNPVSYFDPDGKFAFVIPLVNFAWGAGAVLTFPAWGAAAAVTATGAAVGWATYEVVQKVKAGKQRDGTPKTNTAQNNQFSDAVKQIEKKLERKYPISNGTNFTTEYQDKTTDIIK